MFLVTVERRFKDQLSLKMAIAFCCFVISSKGDIGTGHFHGLLTAILDLLEGKI